MESIYFWADRPALSLLVLWLLSVVFLWAAREPMLQVLRGLGKSFEGGLRSVAGWCRANALDLQRRSRETLLAAGELELQQRMEREFQRIDRGFSEKVGQYSTLHRRLDDLLLRLDADYSKCGESPPEVPGWSGAVEAVAAVPTSGDPNVQKVLEGIRGSMRDAEKRALRKYRGDTAARHQILSRMRPEWKQIQALLSRMKDCVAKVLQTTAKIDRYVDDYGQILKERELAAHSLTYSAAKPFVTSLVVLMVALGGAFINFQLIALPMSELVPAGARIGQLPVSTVSALVIVLMEVAIGIFIMDMLGITDLLPKLAILAPSRRRAILGLALTGLFFLAAVESSLAILREQIVEADSALKLSLAGPEHWVVVAPTASAIPVVGQAVLGFVLPWIMAMLAIPLEMLLDSGRHVGAGLVVLALQAAANVFQVVAHALHSVTTAVPNLYDVYISIPLRIEQGIRAAGAEGRPRRIGAAEPATAEQGVGNPEVA